MSKKRINYCENMYESASLSGVSVWWLKIGFLVVADRKCFENWLYSGLKLDELAIKIKPALDQINQPLFLISNPFL